ncbi:hypothetical protein KBC70_04245 [Candidatus Woesebacteria bacterium]|nr:hypothetical protein [Candidatus Woesebacteria bacterium]
MSNLLLAVLFPLFGFFHLKHASPIHTGRSVKLPTHMWVDLANNGGRCVALFGANVRPIKVIGDNTLAQYAATVGTHKSMCPEKASFTIPTSKLTTMQKDYERALNDIASQNKLVDKLIGEEVYGELVDAGKQRPVYIANTDRYRNLSAPEGSYELYYQSCEIGASDYSPGGTIQARGYTKGMVLYEYHPKVGYTGPGCPDGTLFFDLDN